MKSSEDKTLTSEEIDARREAGLKKLLAMPPTPHAANRKLLKRPPLTSSNMESMRA